MTDSSKITNTESQNTNQSSVWDNSIKTPPAVYHIGQAFHNSNSDNNRKLSGLTNGHQMIDLQQLELVQPTPIPPASSTTTNDQSHSIKVDRTYLFEDLFELEWEKHKSIWTNMQFWEDSFLDAVSQERDILGILSNFLISSFLFYFIFIYLNVNFVKILNFKKII